MTIGPLRYEFIAHDETAGNFLNHLQQHVEAMPFRSPARRIIHLIYYRFTCEEHDEINRDRLPNALAALLPAGAPRKGWNLNGDETGILTWWHSETRHAFFTVGTFESEFDFAYQLPWRLMIEDIIHMGGCLIHGGLAVVGEEGWLFTAPPGGGKTTALSRLTSPWRVVADDAALVWPDGTGGFLASALPTWSVILGVNDPLPAISRWEVGRSLRVAGILLLKQGKEDRVIPLPPVAAASHLYRALSEHPRLIQNRAGIKDRLFNAACRLARGVPAWELELTIDGPFWDAIPGEVPT